MLLLLCTILHFSVDGVCAAVLAEYAVNEPDFSWIVYYFELYNLIAFGGQWLAGLVLDKYRNFVVPSLAVVPLILAMGFFHGAGIFWQAVFIALGNCVFHVSAGILILEHYSGFKEPGIFVSSGAVGLGLGLYRIAGALFFESVCAVCTVMAVFLLIKHPEASARGQHEKSSGKNLLPLMAGAFLLLLCVVLRGFGGNSRVPEYVMLMPCVFMLGKSAGGIVCDMLGWRKTILATFLLCFAALQIHGTVGLVILSFAFNMTMPLTLRLLHRSFPEYPGLTFGLAAGCLLPGAFFGRYFSFPAGIMAVVQFIGLFIAGLIFKRYGSDEKSSYVLRY
ncbi:MAG: hypothetical protein II832_09545 [Synergistaceae bacterium]|nr:hypothetical protein [Synergistaceae bacterium]